MSNSIQRMSHFTPLATTIHVQQVLNMLYSMLSCSYLSTYVVDLKIEIPSSEAYILGIVGWPYIVNAVDGVFTPMSSDFRHQPVSPTGTNVHVCLSHSMLEDCSPVALKLKAFQTSCRGHERSFSLFLLLIGVNPSTKIPLHERYSSLGSKANEYRCFPNRLISCVMVCLGPEDTTRLMPMGLEVLELLTSRHTVTILKCGRFEGCDNFFMWLFVGDTFETNFLPTLLSGVLFSLSISLENLSTLTYVVFKVLCCSQRGWIIPSISCKFKV